MKVNRVGTGAVLGRRLARELTLDELDTVGGGGEQTRTNPVNDSGPRCRTEERTTWVAVATSDSDMKCELGGTY